MHTQIPGPPVVRPTGRPPCRYVAILAIGVLLGCGAENALQYEGETGQPVAIQLITDIPLTDTAFDDGATQPMLIDTGTPVTLLSQHAHSGIPAGRVTGTVEALGLRFPHFPTRVTPVFNASQTCSETVPAGLLGADMLRHFRVGLDYQGAKAWLFGAGDPDAALGENTGPVERVPLELLGGGTITFDADRQRVGATRLIVDTIIEGRERAALLDTGASMLLISETLYEQLDQTDRPQACCEGVFLASRGTVNAELTRVRTLSVGASAMEGVPALVLPDAALFESLTRETGVEIDIVLGGSFLRLFASQIDYLGGLWQMYPYRDPQHLDPQEYLLPGFVFCKAQTANDGVVVLSVFAGSDAEKQGILPGQRVVSVDGRDISTLSGEDVLALMRETPVGQPVALTIRSETGDEQRDVRMEQVLAQFP